MGTQQGWRWPPGGGRGRAPSGEGKAPPAFAVCVSEARQPRPHHTGRASQGCWGPAGEAGWAGQQTPGARGGLALISSCSWSHGNKGTSWGSFSALLPCTPQLGETGSQGCLWGRGLRIQCPIQLPQLLLVPAWGVTAPSCCQPTQKQGWGLGFPQPLAPKVLGHSRRHSLAASAVPRAHGRSWKKGRQRSQSVPVVLCWHRQASRPSPPGPHSLACPLHLHLGKEHGGRASATWGRRQQRKGQSAGSPGLQGGP